MKKIILTLLVIVGCTFSVKAQKEASDANVVGHVVCNGEHLSFINIIIEGTTIGTTTDISGHYQLINLEPGERTIVASGVGYISQKKTITAISNQMIEVKFNLEEDILNLEGVVVSADRNETSRKEAPVVVSVIDSRTFETTQAITIAEGVNFIPGLRIESNCQNCGFSQVRMNGMEGPYSQILINSRPVFSGLAGVYGMELLPASMVDRIEVVRGGGSALYGGNAIAGTINIITKEPTSNTFEVETRAGLIGIGNKANTKLAGDYLLNVNGSFVSEDRKSGLFVYGMARSTDPFDENGDGFSERVMTKNRTFGLTSYHKPTLNSKLNLDFYSINEFRRGGNKFNYLPHESDITEQLSHIVTGGSLAYDLFLGENYNKLTFYAAGQTVDRESYYGAEQDPNGYGNTDDLTTSLGSQYSFNVNKLSTLMFGIDNTFNTLEDVKLGSQGDPNNVVTDQYINTLGTYAQYNWKTDRIKTSIGLRYDNYIIRDNNVEEGSDQNEDINGNVMAPRLNILFDISPVLEFRIGYSRGYRAPQIFDEDLHIEASGSRTTVHTNSPDLKQETSHSLISSFRYTQPFGNVMTEILAEGFYTRLDDPFSYKYIVVDSTNTMWSVRQNAASGAFVTGVNLELNAVFPFNLVLQAGLTIQKSQYEEAQSWGDSDESTSTNFMRTPDQYGYLTLDYDVIKNLCLSLSSTYTGRMHIPHFGLDYISDEEWDLINSGDISGIGPDRQNEIEAIINGDVIEGQRLERSEQFLVLALRIAYDIKISKEASLQVYTGIQNIFNQLQNTYDRGVYRDAGYVYGPYQPRTISAGVKFGNSL